MRKSLNAIEKDFSRRTLKSTIEGITTSDDIPLKPTEPIKDIISKPATSGKKRCFGEDIPWKTEEWLLLYQAEKWGKASGNLSLARSVFLPRRSETDIKSQKQTEAYREFVLRQKEYETMGTKKRKLQAKKVQEVQSINSPGKDKVTAINVETTSKESKNVSKKEPMKKKSKK